MCGITGGKHEFILLKISLQSGIPINAIQIGVIYVDLTMSSSSFAKSVKHAITINAKEKWPQDAKEEHKRTTDKSREF